MISNESSQMNKHPSNSGLTEVVSSGVVRKGNVYTLGFKSD